MPRGRPREPLGGAAPLPTGLVRSCWDVECSKASETSTCEGTGQRAHLFHRETSDTRALLEGNEKKGLLERTLSNTRRGCFPGTERKGDLAKGLVGSRLLMDPAHPRAPSPSEKHSQRQGREQGAVQECSRASEKERQAQEVCLVEMQQRYKSGRQAWNWAQEEEKAGRSRTGSPSCTGWRGAYLCWVLPAG